MKNYLIAIGISLLLSSCMVTYVGDKYPASTAVDVFYAAHDVTKPYKVIGHMTYPNSGKKSVKAKFIDYAKSIGADAIVITGTESTSDTQSAYVNADALK
ncbi:MAG: hypothetical protein JST32_05495, partial [Bacteroidetes bacterium]|nr:hypothetical protein [Bacteroidota bacterium]